MRRNKSLFFSGLFVFASLGAGCSKPAEDKEVRDSNSTQEEENPSSSASTDGPKGTSFEIQPQRKFDIMFFVDNSGSMGIKQRKLSQSIAAFTDVFASPGVNADLRVGVAGTDVPGRSNVGGCKSDRNGSLMYSSCLDRPESFIEARGRRSNFNTACKSVCSLDSAALKTKEVTVPGDPTLVSRSWIELADGKTNLVDPKVKLSDALACLLPQGIHGCGFESQLEAMRNGIRYGTVNPKQDIPSVVSSFGFVRSDASLAVVHVTDELDCSVNRDHEMIRTGHISDFEQATFGKESKVFWVTGQDDAASTNCLRAGTECKNDQNGVYQSCEPRDWDMKRQALDVDQITKGAVLRPVAWYVEMLNELREEKRRNDPNTDVFVGMIGGVNAKDFSIEYRSGHSGTSKEQENYKHFGIGFGCAASMEFLEEKDPGQEGVTVPAGVEVQFGLPPIRMRAVVDKVSTGPGQRYGSVCAADWSDQLAAIARTITQGSLSAKCVPYSVKDADQTAKGLQPRCQVLQEGGGEDGKEILECSKDQGVYVKHRERRSFVPQKDARACYILASDRDGKQTSDAADDMSAACAGSGNLELRIYRRIESSDPAPTKWTVKCDKA